MKILNIGSINIDHVYQVDDFVKPGETKRVSGFQVFPGGKGLNQSAALAKAGAEVYHAGRIGKDGEWLLEVMKQAGVHTQLIKTAEEETGRTVIQVNAQGQNAILYCEGANRRTDRTYVREVLEQFGAGDILVLQNEVNDVPFIIDCAWERGMKTALNPSPVNESLCRCSLDKVTWLLLNEIEGEWLTGEKEPEKIAAQLAAKHPRLEIVLTLGSKGVFYQKEDSRIFQPAFPVQTVDTTGAGDTFTGYYMKCMADGMSVETALKTAAKAASISVSRKGAAVSIPVWEEVEI